MFGLRGFSIAIDYKNSIKSFRSVCNFIRMKNQTTNDSERILPFLFFLYILTRFPHSFFVPCMRIKCIESKNPDVDTFISSKKCCKNFEQTEGSFYIILKNKTYLDLIAKPLSNTSVSISLSGHLFFLKKKKHFYLPF